MKNYLYNIYFVKRKFLSFGKDTKIERHVFFKNRKNISIGSNCLISSFCRLECWCLYNEQKFNPRITIGDGVYINRNCHISSINKITIFDNCLLGSNILITDHNHGSATSAEKDCCPYKRNLFSKGVVEIGENTWIGDNSTILSGVKIGKGCIVGANTVVTKSIPDYSIVCGNPGKIIRKM